MAIETWIDALARRWEISDGKGGTVRSYRLYEKAEFPDAIAETPCALTLPAKVVFKEAYKVAIWSGKTEFHLIENLDKSRLPDVVLFFNRILAAAAADVTLGGLVSYFMLSEEDAGSITGPLEMTWGSESPHLGMVVNWIVKENLTVSVA